MSPLLKKLFLHLDSWSAQLHARFLAETGLSCFTCSVPCVASLYWPVSSPVKEPVLRILTDFQCTFYCTEVVQEYQVAWFRTNSVYSVWIRQHFQAACNRKAEINTFSALFQACPGRQLVFLVLSLLQHTWDTYHSSCGNNYQPPNRY